MEKPQLLISNQVNYIKLSFHTTLKETHAGLLIRPENNEAKQCEAKNSCEAEAKNHETEAEAKH